MEFLIDRHTFLWAISAKSKHNQSASQLIEYAGNEISISTASLWEIAIKISVGKLRLNSP
jgi:PIN domain nuclease of toxin-antitoxin system